MSYYAGDELKVTVTFKDASGTAADPTDATVSYQDVAGTTTKTTKTLTDLTKDSTGVYHLTIDTTDFADGAWVVQAVGTGAVAAVDDAEFVIKARPLG